MSYLRKSVAKTVALDRIERVLQAKLEPELEAIADDGCPLQVPRKQDYHKPGNHRTNAIVAAPLAIVIEQSKPSRPYDRESGDGTEYTATNDLFVRIQVSFGAGAYSPLTINGKQQSEAEWLDRKADRYAGAILETLCKYARDNTGAIHDIELGNDYTAAQDIEDFGMRGIAVLEFTITQHVSFPQNAKDTDPTDFVA